ncbi:hypothetical protein [Bacteroides sp.]
MKKQKLIYLLALLFVFGCSSPQKSMITTRENLRETAIHNAIGDFSSNCRLFKEDSVFSVNFKDSVFHKSTLVQVDKRIYGDKRTHEWKRGALCDGIVGVEIGASDYLFYYSEETKETLPSRYVIKDGKLFYWWDGSCPVTEEIITILYKYNRLQTNLIIPEFSNDDNQKGVDYYFCKNNVSKYKRIITNIGMGYYEPPKLKCIQSLSLHENN